MNRSRYFACDSDRNAKSAEPSLHAGSDESACAALRDRRFTSFLLPGDAERFALHRNRLLGGAVRSHCDVTIVSARGGGREVRIENVRTLRFAAGWRMAIVDLTSVLALERELQEARRLEALGTLASGVAHDFNNLLMGVLGCADIALDQLPPDSSARDSITAMREAALHGRSVATQLLNSVRRAEEARPPSAPPPRMSGDPQRLRVLLVDDEPLVRRSLRHYLEKAGHHVLEAHTGSQALCVLNAPDVFLDVLVTDVLLPEIDGPQLAAMARERRPDLGTLFISGHAADELADRGVIPPDARVLRKPFTEKELQAAVERCAASRCAAAR